MAGGLVLCSNPKAYQRFFHLRSRQTALLVLVLLILWNVDGMVRLAEPASWKTPRHHASRADLHENPQWTVPPAVFLFAPFFTVLPFFYLFFFAILEPSVFSSVASALWRRRNLPVRPAAATAMWLRMSQLGDLLERFRRPREKKQHASEKTNEKMLILQNLGCFCEKFAPCFPHSTAAAENGSTRAERWSLFFTWRQPKQTFLAPIPCSMTRHKTAKS